MLQIKGPQRGNGRVSFHTEYTRSRGGTSRAFWVVIGSDRLRKLGQGNRGLKEEGKTMEPEGKTMLKRTSEPEEGDEEQLRPEGENGTAQATDKDIDNANENEDEDEDQNSNQNTNQNANQNSNQNSNSPSKDSQASRTDADSESEIEILEVRPIHYSHSASDSDSDLSSLDEELNHALSSTVTVPTQIDHVYRGAPVKPEPIHKILPNIYKAVPPRASPAPPGYRNIPPNLVSTIQRELNLFFDTGNDDDLEVVGRVVFSLKDPYSATKIRLPVKATTCRHFECFDFDNFCLFHKLPLGIKGSLKKNLVLKSHDSRKLEQLFIRQQQQLASGVLSFSSPGLVYPQFSEHGQMFFTEIYNRTPPLYKCPLCDEKFGLKQLYISDIFNFFVKTTPLHTTRIELVESDRYKILEDEVVEPQEKNAEYVVLSGDDSESEPDASMSVDDFNDGLDDVLSKIRQGDGTWGNPVTLD
ncbi:hypothetical protein EJF18_80307 [Clavispora lusitaniae]|uniref:Uncharacterized protein n=1 Tax=Clavispora lusitaniae TaxID=36911 RepID=A0ACD0WSP2_CLALS|nr:hypothetical protein E0198_004991 [Clavispora lusitaniae]QFZ30584.1 hypothetical protein EJF14_80307 [Clavispora lusitaniae]QFZ36246.1 hypothetical protein EJF16_80307 [Clavispora lusitaniae]QFZ41930.1 hypothetical protein EJF15_80307 [Clavispora lusitaniae]QFZ47606.1 hypothetical protein EJF18_80307 [Clavispora lusitaniae]